MAVKIALTAGHYKYTPGKRCMKELDPEETREWVLNDRIVTKIENGLKKYGAEVLRTDDSTGEKNVTLRQRTDKANAFNADIYLSIHHNAGAKGTAAGGIVAYVQKGITDKITLEWQKEFYDAVIKTTGLKGNRSKPLAQADLFECRETVMPAVLLECGFMDSSTDVPIILTEEFADEVADACVSAIVVKTGLQAEDADVSETPYKAGNDYTVKVPLKVRTGAGTEYSQKKRNELTADGYKNSVNGTGAALKPGTVVTALEVINKNGDTWLRIPSGYICAVYNGEVYVK